MLVLVQAVFKFGYGLSFTSFTYKPSSSVVGPVSLRPVQALLAEAAKAGTPFVPTAGAEADPIVRFSVAVTNTGDVARQSPPPPFVARLFPVSWYLLERASDARGVQNAVFTRTMREHCMWHGFQHSTLFFLLFLPQAADDGVLGFLHPPGAGTGSRPLQTLFGFERIHVPAGATVTAMLYPSHVAFTETMADGSRQVLAGPYTASFGVQETAQHGQGFAELPLSTELP